MMHRANTAQHARVSWALVTSQLQPAGSHALLTPIPVLCTNLHFWEVLALR